MAGNRTESAKDRERLERELAAADAVAVALLKAALRELRTGTQLSQQLAAASLRRKVLT